jgi:uncharacterized protein YggE
MRLLWFAALALAATLAHAGEDGNLRRSVTVSGQGEVSAVPDRARLSLAVEALRPELKAAQDEANKAMRSLLADLKSLGLKDADLDASGVSVQPEYVWDDKTRSNRLTGYRARRGIDILVNNLDQLGDVVLIATRDGINNVSPPALESSHARELQRAALTRATEDARDKAALLAQTLGVKLGSIHSLNAAENYVPPPVPMMRMKAAAAPEAFDSGNQEMGFAAGTIKFNATVNADFDLIAP